MLRCIEKAKQKIFDDETKNSMFKFLRNRNRMKNFYSVYRTGDKKIEQNLLQHIKSFDIKPQDMDVLQTGNKNEKEVLEAKICKSL